MPGPAPSRCVRFPASFARRATALAIAAAALATIALADVALAATEPEFTLVLREHRFQPDELAIPSRTRVRIVVDNQDATPEEFDSHALNRERVVPGRSKGAIYVGPLAPGRYEFIGEFNADTARGVLIAQ